MFAALGGPALVRRRRRRRTDQRVVILEYHDVSAGPEREGVVSARRFRRHLRYLTRHYRVAPLSDAVAMLASTPLDGDVVAITFDDGYLGTYRHAWPVLREAGVSTTVFVCTGFLDGHELWFDVAERCLDAAVASGARFQTADPELRSLHTAWSQAGRKEGVRNLLKSLAPEPRDDLLRRLRSVSGSVGEPARPLTWAAVREMQSAGTEIGCHTASHPILSTLPADRQEREIVSARDRIATKTGVAPSLFAYPNGAPRDFTDETVDIVRDAGFSAACTTKRVSNRPGCDPLRLGRIGVGREPSVMLAARIAGLFDERVRARLSRYGLGIEPAPIGMGALR